MSPETPKLGSLYRSQVWKSRYNISYVMLQHMAQQVHMNQWKSEQDDQSKSIFGDCWRRSAIQCQHCG